jgi:PAS domain S-box-containing protein
MPLFNRKVQLAFGSALLTLLILGGMSYRAIAVSSESDRWVRHTHEILETLQDLLSTMRSVESSYRGFALTGNESSLGSYSTSLARLAQEEATLRKLTADNLEQQRHQQALEKSTARKIQFGELAIGLRRTKGLAAAADVIRNGLGERIMDDFQGTIREMQNEEERLLVLRDADAKQQLAHIKNIQLLGTALGLLISAGAGLSALRDGSGRGVAEAALLESEEKYQILIYEIQDYAIFMLDPGGRVVTWNAGAERIKGYQAREIVGHNYSCFFTPEDIERGRPEEILRMAAVNGRHEEQAIRVRKNGSRFLASVIFTALRDPAGNLRGYSEISRDLTESKESEAKYRGLLEAAPDAIIVADARGQIVLVNAETLRMFGYRREELVGQAIEILVPE